MDKPKCRLCGHKHWGDEHVWPDEPKTETLYPVIGVEGTDYVTVKSGKKKFDRVAYQREYMRKRRAKT